MPRARITLVAAVVIVAVGTIAVLITLDKLGSQDTSPAPAGLPAAAPVEPQAPAVQVEVVPAIAPEATSSAEPVSMDAKVAGVLDSFSEDEFQALQKEMGRRQMRKGQDQMKHQLPSDTMLYGLQWHNGGAIKLDEAQKASIQQISDGFRPRQDAALKAAWEQDAAIRDRIAAAESGGRQEEIRGLIEQMQQSQQQIVAVHAALDKEYRELLRGVLTAEQMEYLESPYSKQP